MDDFKWPLSKLIPILSLIILGNSYLYLYIYYKRFNVNIADYLELSEALIAFLAQTLFFLLLYLIGAIIAFFIMSPNIKKLGSKDRDLFYKIETGLLSRLKLHWRFNKYIAILALSSIVSGAISIFRFGYKPSTLFSYSILAFTVLLSIISDEINRKIFLIEGKKINRYTIFLMKTILFYILMTVNTALIKSDYPKNQIRADISEIKFNDVTLKTDSNYYVIGMTKNYLFMFNEHLHRTTVYDRSNIEFIKTLKP